MEQVLCFITRQVCRKFIIIKDNKEEGHMSAINFPIATTSLFVNTLTTNKIIYLPAASTVGAGRLFYIKDICGNAARSSIYISTMGMDRLENRFQPSTLYALMSTNYGSVLMAPDGALNWYFLQHYHRNAISSLGSSTVVGGSVVATGGTVTTYGSYKVHTFTTVGTATFTITSPASVSVNYLVVAGGGAGGVGRGGGGGAGGVLTGTTNLSAGSYTITVGAGGLNAFNDAQGGDGGSSSIGSTVVTTGGGGGGGWTINAGRNGGSGGGASAASTAAAGTGISGQGFAGSVRLTDLIGGGGGGAGAAATNQNGAIGITSMITGSTTYYAGGGGAGAWGGGATAGVAFGGTYQVANGTYGGGNGANTNGTLQPYQNAVANTGGGGGGQEGYGGNSGAGGSGIVIISYLSIFTPTSIATLVQWLDATDNTTVLTAVSGSQVANGGSAGYWGDKSGSGNHVTTNTVAPTYSLSLINSKAGLNFQNSAGMISTAFAKSSNVTLCMVGTVKSTRGDWGTFWGHFTSGRHDADVQLRYTQSTTHINWHTNNNNGSSHLPYTIDSPVLYSCTMSGGTVMFMQQTNTTGTTSVTITESLSWAAGSAPVWIGRSDSGECINSYISEIAYFQSVLSTADRQKMEGYLAWKWGLNTYLPIGHPYLSAAP